MPTTRLTTEDQGRLLFRSAHEPRRNLKRMLKDLGGHGSAEELDAALAQAQRSPEALAIAERLERQREIAAGRVEAGVDGRVAEMLADLRVRMQERGITQEDLAASCGWAQSLVSAYLSGSKQPGIGNLAKMADALGLVWRLTGPRK